jgi:hypothetical protein
VFIAANRCPLSDVTGRLAEVSRLLRRFGILFPRSDFVSRAPESTAHRAQKEMTRLIDRPTLSRTRDDDRVVPHGRTCSTLYFDFRLTDLLSL